ncbi:hypothetical protein CONPUDRAFT_150797 [Coniophora puteana RWD-64-598 SS2]|uniref:Uncharacterized protein n=1 Tax=Coniophora puteana (strain RWD-64-598) TaxID=741705 RepID=A0A5M3MX61_CONPW|nr:uncharacterized protein CONPUDRAFT_150797 [Coniophora puteana RWD-64-598 SS2]EIW83733.1 hypothetical protein CONPUDRAFT_150797 [Coniophora puteana RWD-64-598 SS2]
MEMEVEDRTKLLQTLIAVVPDSSNIPSPLCVHILFLHSDQTTDDKRTPLFAI